MLYSSLYLKEDSEKAGLKLNIKKKTNKHHGIWSHHFMTKKKGNSRSSGGGLVAKSCLTLVTPWTVACQAPLSMGFFRQEY